MTNMTQEDLDRLSAEATQGEWAYRPDKHDDWGVVKSEPLPCEGFPSGLRCVLAQFRDPNAMDEEALHLHREARTDPWRGNAQFVATLVNLYRSGRLKLVPEGEPDFREQAIGCIRSLLHQLEQTTACDDMAGQIFPEEKSRNGQPRDELAKASRRTMNEARAFLSVIQASQGGQHG